MTTETAEYIAIIERLTRVEQENRKLKRAGLAILLVVAASFLMAQTLPTKVVEANEFVLKDASGKTRAALWFGQSPSASADVTRLDFFDKDGNVSASLISEDKAHAQWLALGEYSSGSAASVTLNANASGSSLVIRPPNKPLEGISLSAVPEKSQLSVSATGELFAGFTMLDQKQGVSFDMRGPAPANRELQLDAGSSLRGVGMTISEEGSFGLYDSNGMSVDKNGNHATLAAEEKGPYLSLRDSQGFESRFGMSETVKTTTGQSLSSSAASLKMFDKEGKVIWSAP